MKHEPYHDSPLAQFLLCRALQNRVHIGHRFFWHVKAELHLPELAERCVVCCCVGRCVNDTVISRFTLMLEAYLLGCGPDQVSSLCQQSQFVRQLDKVCREVEQRSGLLTSRQEALRKILPNVTFPHGVQLPIDPRFVADRFFCTKIVAFFCTHFLLFAWFVKQYQSERFHSRAVQSYGLSQGMLCLRLCGV